MGKIKITSWDAKKANLLLPINRETTSKLAKLIKSPLLMIIEDAFYHYCGKTRTDREMENKWKRFREILEQRL